LFQDKQTHTLTKMHAAALLVDILHYKLEGRRFVADGVFVSFIDINTSGRTMALKSTQPPTETNSRIISWG